MNRRKQFVFSIGIVIGLILVTIFGIVIFKWQENRNLEATSDVNKEELVSTSNIDYSTSFKDAEALEAKDGNVCVIYFNGVDSDYSGYEANSQICPNSYLICPNIQGEEKSFYNMAAYRSEYEYSKFLLDLYDVNTKKYVKTIDVNKIIKDYPGYGANWMTDVCWANGKEQILIIMYPTDSSEYEDGNRRFLLIDPDTENVQFSEAKDEFWESSDETKSVIKDLELWIDVNGFTLNEEDNGATTENFNKGDVYSYNNWPETVLMDIPTDKLRAENEKLYTMFPKLKEYQGKKGYIATLILNQEDAADIFLN